jgi:hypothetical protein
VKKGKGKADAPISTNGRAAAAADAAATPGTSTSSIQGAKNSSRSRSLPLGETTATVMAAMATVAMATAAITTMVPVAVLAVVRVQERTATTEKVVDLEDVVLPGIPKILETILITCVQIIPIIIGPALMEAGGTIHKKCSVVQPPNNWDNVSNVQNLL